MGLVFANSAVDPGSQFCGWQHGGMLISSAYRLTRKIVSATLTRRDVPSDAELLVLRHENTVPRRQVKKVCYRPEDRLWFAALSGLIPRRRWAEAFSVTPDSSREPSTLRWPAPASGYSRVRCRPSGERDLRTDDRHAATRSCCSPCCIGHQNGR